jgi:hypothetical protein
LVRCSLLEPPGANKAFIGKNGDDYNSKEFLQSLKDGVGYAYFFGHGYPIGLDFDTSMDHSNSNISYLVSCPKEHQRLLKVGKNSIYVPDNLTIKPTIFILESCLTGLTGNVYNTITKEPFYDCEDFRNHSISLKMIRSGAAAYVGSTTIGGVSSVDPHLMASALNWSLGDIVTHRNNKFISHSLLMYPFPFFVNNFPPRITLFGDPTFKPSLPNESIKNDFFKVEKNRINIFGNIHLTVVEIKHSNNFDFSFGKIELNRDIADKPTVMKWCNKFICFNKIYNLWERVSEDSLCHRIEKDHDKIYLCWDARHPDLLNNTLKIVVTPNRPFLYIIEN